MKENTCLACQECTNDYDDGNGNHCYDGRESPCMNAHYENDIEEIDLYDTKIDDDAMKSLKKADDCLLMIGVIPPLKSDVVCTSEQSQKIYDEINMNLVKENIALKDMLSARESEIRNLKVLLDRAKKELANERARSLKIGEK